MAETRQSLYVASLLSGRIGQDAYADILARVPDSFFRADDRQQTRAWRNVLNAVFEGERNPDRLARIAGQECR